MHIHAGTPAARRARTSVLPLSRTPSRADARSERALAARARRAPCCAWNSGRRRCVPPCLDRMCHQGRCPCASYLSLAVRQSAERRRAGSPSASLGFFLFGGAVAEGARRRMRSAATAGAGCAAAAALALCLSTALIVGRPGSTGPASSALLAFPACAIPPCAEGSAATSHLAAVVRGLKAKLAHLREVMGRWENTVHTFSQDQRGVLTDVSGQGRRVASEARAAERFLSLPGPTGPAGLRGHAGVRGPDGSMGAMGPVGPLGYAGTQGVSGAKGREVSTAF